jgi:hypothetical protein
MKKFVLLKTAYILSMFWLILLLTSTAFAQKEIVRETRDLPAFDQLEAGGAFEVEITFGEPQKVEVESKQKDIGNIQTNVNGKKLVLSSKGINDNAPLKIYITVPTLSSVEVHGAADVRGLNTLKADMLSLEASGAASVELILDINTLRSEVSGAADLELSGHAEHHSANVSGAATLDAADLKTATTDADVSGAATARVNSENVTGQTSGAGEIYTNDGKDIEKSSDDVVINIDDDGDTTYVHVPGTNIEVSESDDSIKVKIGNRVIVIDEDGDVKTRRNKWPKFNGHWAGVDLGFNGYVNKDFNMNFPKEYEYMDLRMEKSVAVNLNFFEQNIPLAKNQKWGIVTGLGLAFNDYKFQRPTRLSMDSSALEGYLYDDISIRKSKLSMYYLTLPVLFEFQTAPAYHKDGFHINAGVIIGARLSSHTKVYYNELNTAFNLTQYNPETGKYEAVLEGISPNDPKEHHYGDWFLQPFKFDASVRIGWNFLNFWANYSLNTLFREGKGPELYPWSAGITLVCF